MLCWLESRRKRPYAGKTRAKKEGTLVTIRTLPGTGYKSEVGSYFGYHFTHAHYPIFGVRQFFIFTGSKCTRMFVL